MGQEIHPVILGDPAYSMLNWLLKGYPENVNTPRIQRCFNYRLSRTRMTVENTFGRWKGRFSRSLSARIWRLMAAWPSGQHVGLAIRRSRVRVPLWPLAGFVLGRPEYKFSATLVNSQLVAFCQLGFLILLCNVFELFVSKYLSGVPVN